MSDRLRRSMVPVGAVIVDAMRSLEDSMSQLVLVVDDQDRLTGVMTDGDIRRALLDGASLSSPVGRFVNADCFTVGPEAGRADVVELMQARQIAQVPVVDDSGRVVGLHLLHEMLAVVERPNSAVIMAGGKGTRLGSLTETIPKPMLPVAGRPILERIVLHLVGSGIRHIYLSVNYLAEVIQAHFGDGRRFGCTVEYLRESEPLGTGGALGLLPAGADRSGHPVLVMNGDLVTQANVGRLIDVHEGGMPAATMAVRQYLSQIPFGCVETEGDKLVGFVEKPVTARLVNAGIYVLAPEWLDVVPAPEPISMPEVIVRIQDRGGLVRVFELDEEWIDVGRRDQLDRARHGE